MSAGNADAMKTSLILIQPVTSAASHLCHDEFFQIDIITECHSTSMDAKNAALCLGIRKREFNLPVYSAWSDQSWVQRVYPVCRHDDLHIVNMLS